MYVIHNRLRGWLMVIANGPRQVQKAFSGACALRPVAAT